MPNACKFYVFNPSTDRILLSYQSSLWPFMAHSVSIRQSWHQHKWTPNKPKHKRSKTKKKLLTFQQVPHGQCQLRWISRKGPSGHYYLGDEHEGANLPNTDKAPGGMQTWRNSTDVTISLQDGDPIHPRVHAVVKVINEQLVPWQNRNWPMYLEDETCWGHIGR